MGDESPEDNLQAHRELERRHRLPRHDPRAVAEVLGENEQHPALILEHHAASPVYRRSLRTRARRPADCSFHLLYAIYILYKI